MCSLENKTPVSILQEYLVAKKMIPHYELTQNGVGTHDPEFTFRVNVGGLWEEGTGKSKQQAKHKAAEKMLISLKVIADKEVENDDENSEFTGTEFKENYVGLLKDYCFTHNYPEAKYYLDEEAGPPHSRIFKMTCAVSQLHNFGISKTKKLAKQQAAFKMLERLKGLIKEQNGDVTDNCLDSNVTVVPKKIPAITLDDDEIISKYNAIRPSNITTYKEPAAYYKDHERAYIGLPETSSTLTKLLKKDTSNHDNAFDLLKEIANELEVALSFKEVPAKLKGTKCVIMTITVVPPISGVGENVQNAAKSLLKSLLLLCK